MLTSARGVEFIIKHEGNKLKAYKCPAGVLTIGCGHTGPDVKVGMEITEEQSRKLLAKDLKSREDFLTKQLGRAQTNQNQFDAMISLMYNIGNGAFAKSSVLRNHKNAEYKAAAESFLLWDKATVHGKKVVLPGLKTRREHEQKLYLESV